MGDTLNRRYEAGLAGFMRANQGKNLIPLIVDAADAAVDRDTFARVLWQWSSQWQRSPLGWEETDAETRADWMKDVDWLLGLALGRQE